MMVKMALNGCLKHLDKLIRTYIISIFAESEEETTKILKELEKNQKYREIYIDKLSNEEKNVFNEAIKFFSDACQKEPKHYIAKMRWGFAEMMQGNYFASKKLFKEVYSAEPKLQNLNIYIARNYALENDSKSAIKHYKEEYKNHNELSSAMELANYLAYIGQQNDAMDLIATLQEKYPGKMLILKSFGEKSNN